MLIVTHDGVIRVLGFLKTNQAVDETHGNVSMLAFDSMKLLA